LQDLQDQIQQLSSPRWRPDGSPFLNVKAIIDLQGRWLGGSCREDLEICCYGVDVTIKNGGLQLPHSCHVHASVGSNIMLHNLAIVRLPSNDVEGQPAAMSNIVLVTSDTVKDGHVTFSNCHISGVIENNLRATISVFDSVCHFQDCRFTDCFSCEHAEDRAGGSEAQVAVIGAFGVGSQVHCVKCQMEGNDGLAVDVYNGACVTLDDCTVGPTLRMDGKLVRVSGAGSRVVVHGGNVTEQQTDAADGGAFLTG
jgi:hypothetical protein